MLRYNSTTFPSRGGGYAQFPWISWPVVNYLTNRTQHKSCCVPSEARSWLHFYFVYLRHLPWNPVTILWGSTSSLWRGSKVYGWQPGPTWHKAILKVGHARSRALKSWGSGTTQRDGVGREVGRGFRMGGHMCTRGWFMLMYGKNHHNVVIILQLN